MSQPISQAISPEILEVLRRRIRELEEENARLRQSDEAQRQFEILINAFPMPAFGAEPDGTIRHLSQMAKEYAGVTESSLADEGWLTAVHPDERQSVRNKWEQCVKDGIPFEIECRLRRVSDGTFRWHLTRAAAMRDSQGSIVKWFGTMLDIDTAKELEHTLRQSEERLRLAQEAAAIGAFDWDLETNQVEWWSDRIYQIAQVSRQATPTFSEWMARVAPEDYERAINEARQAIETSAPLISEYRIIRGDGERRWVQGRAQIFERPGGGRRMLGVISDITDRKKAEHDLHDSEARFRSIFETAAVGMALADMPEGRWIAVNPRLAEMTGYTQEELLEKTFLELTHPDDREANRALYNELAAERSGSYVFDKRYRRKDGAYIWVRATVSVVKEAEGRPRMSVAHIQDMTERRQSELIYRAIGDSIPYGIWVCDAAGRNVYSSQSLFSLTGMTQQECRELGWGPWLHPEDAAKLAATWEERMSTGEMWDVELQWRGLDGEYHPALVRGGPVKDDLGVITGWAGINLDISARKQAELELRSANADLEQFAYAASHDLREPLRTVTSYAQLLSLRQGDKLDADGKQFLAFIVGGATRMQTLVNDLLFYARVIHSPNTPEEAFQMVSLGEVFQDAVGGLKTAIEESGAEIQADPLPVVEGDTTQLSQLFQNLLSNAIKYRNPDLPARIHLGVREENNWFVFSLTDNGIGFKPAYAERIFGIFKRLHGSDVPGTGIGLAICRKIVERHKGRIWAKSEPGKGATFYFTLPRRDI